MLISERDVQNRLNSAGNLINKLRQRRQDRLSSMSVFGMGNRDIEPSYKPPIIARSPVLQSTFPVPEISTRDEEAPSPLMSSEDNGTDKKEIAPVNPIIGLDEILDNADAKIKLTHAHNKSLDLLVKTVEAMYAKVDEIKPERLPALATAAGKIVESIRKERVELGKNVKGKNVHFHFYAPEQQTLDQYKVIDVSAK